MTTTYPAPVLPYYGPVYHDSGNGNLPIVRIVIHCTAGSDAKGSTGTASYFRQKASTGSAHYIVDQALTIRTAYDTVVAWHAPPNTHSIGIEMCCSLASSGKGHWTLPSHITMMRRTAKLTAQLLLHHGLPPVKLSIADVRAGKRGVCGHWDVTRAFGQSSHTDPEAYFPWDTFMAMVRAEYDAIVAAHNPAPAPKEWDEMATKAEVQEASYAADYQYGIDFWVNGTGAALIKKINAIATATVANGNAIAALAKQTADEDVADDNEFRAAVAEIRQADADMAAALAKLTEEVPAPAPKA